MSLYPVYRYNRKVYNIHQSTKRWNFVQAFVMIENVDALSINKNLRERPQSYIVIQEHQYRICPTMYFSILSETWFVFSHSFSSWSFRLKFLQFLILSDLRHWRFWIVIVCFAHSWHVCQLLTSQRDGLRSCDLACWRGSLALLGIDPWKILIGAYIAVLP